MKIDLDDVTNEYVWRSIGSMRDLVDVKPKELRQAGLDVTEFREKVFMRVLKTAVEMGVVVHRFDAVECVDVFDSEPKLIQNWEKIFPGQEFAGGDCGGRVGYDMSGDRSRFFNKAWLAREEGRRARESIVA